MRVLMLLALLVVTFLTLNYAGFCYARMEFVSDEEKIRSAVKWVIGRQIATVVRYEEGKVIFKSVPMPRYASVDEFISRNPGCCRIGPEGGDGYIPITLPGRLFHGQSDIVVVEHAVPYVSDRGVSETAVKKDQLTVSSCGRVVTD